MHKKNIFPYIFSLLLLLTTGTVYEVKAQDILLQGINPNSRLTKLQDMQFGTFFPGISGGTVTISLTGVRSSTGSIVLLPGATPAPAIYEFYSQGKTNAYVQITSTPLNRMGGGGQLPLSVTYSPENFNISNGTTIRITVGGTITVGPLTSNPNGVYNGTLSITLISQ